MGIIITPSVAQISSTSCYCPDNCDSFVIRPKTDIDNDSFVIRPKPNIDNDSFVIRPKTDICGRFIRPSDRSKNSRRVRVVTARERHDLSTEEMIRLWEKAGTLSSASPKWYKRPLKWIGAIKSVPRYHHIKKWDVSEKTLHIFAFSTHADMRMVAAVHGNTATEDLKKLANDQDEKVRKLAANNENFKRP